MTLQAFCTPCQSGDHEHHQSVPAPWECPCKGECAEQHSAEPPLIAHSDGDYVFPTWRAALADSQSRIADAYAQRARVFRRASDAGISYRDIGEATGLSAAAVGKIIGRERQTLDSIVLAPAREEK